MKKIMIILCLLLTLSGCEKTMDEIIQSEPSIKGIVKKVYAHHFVMAVTDEDLFPRGQWSYEVTVPLNDLNNDSYTSLKEGNHVIVYYDGNIQNGNIEKAYAITLFNEGYKHTLKGLLVSKSLYDDGNMYQIQIAKDDPNYQDHPYVYVSSLSNTSFLGFEVIVHYNGAIQSNGEISQDNFGYLEYFNNAESKYDDDAIPSIMINDILYRSTDLESKNDDPIIDGRTDSLVEPDSLPYLNYQSNIADNLEYHIVDKGIVDVKVDGKWIIFIADILYYEDKTYFPSNLSDDTIIWLDWYNSLKDDEKLAVSYVPSELSE